MAVTLSALRYLPGPDIGPELLRSARFYDIVIRGDDGIDRSAFKRCCGGLTGKEHMVGPIKPNRQIHPVFIAPPMMHFTIFYHKIRMYVGDAAIDHCLYKRTEPAINTLTDNKQPFAA